MNTYDLIFYLLGVFYIHNENEKLSPLILDISVLVSANKTYSSRTL